MKRLEFCYRLLKFANIKFLFVNEFMDLVSRLKLFLNQNGISNSQFADTCGIPRPTLSQLLNGRNKKVSDEIIAKIHASYPSLSIMWLMFGDGDMFVPNANTEIVSKTQVDENTDLVAAMNQYWKMENQPSKPSCLTTTMMRIS